MSNLSTQLGAASPRINVDASMLTSLTAGSIGNSAAIADEIRTVGKIKKTKHNDFIDVISGI